MRSRLQVAIVLAALVLAPAADAEIWTVQADPPDPGVAPDPDPFPFPWPLRPPFGPQERRDVFRVIQRHAAAPTVRCIIEEPTPKKHTPTKPLVVPIADPKQRPPFGTQDAIKITEYWRSFLDLQVTVRDRPKSDADWVATWEKSWKDLAADGSVSCNFGEMITGQDATSGFAAQPDVSASWVSSLNRPPWGTQDIKPSIVVRLGAQDVKPSVVVHSPWGTQDVGPRFPNFVNWK